MKLLEQNFRHTAKNAVVFGDHHHDSLCVEKLNLNHSLSIAFVNYSYQAMISEKKEQLERYILHWDILLFDESPFDNALPFLHKIGSN